MLFCDIILQISAFQQFSRKNRIGRSATKEILRNNRHDKIILQEGISAKDEAESLYFKYNCDVYHIHVECLLQIAYTTSGDYLITHWVTLPRP
jgi:hypothetical protein